MVGDPLLCGFGKFKFTVFNGFGDKLRIMLNLKPSVAVGSIILEGVVAMR